MTAVIELTQADGHTESLTVPQALVPDLQLASALFQTERGRWYFSVGERLFSMLVEQLQQLPWADIEDRQLVETMYSPAEACVEAIHEFFSPSIDEWTSLELAFPGEKDTINALALMAFLTRAIRRDGFTIQRLIREMSLVILWLLNLEEFARRGCRHPMGGILFLLAFASQEDYHRLDVDGYAKAWVSIARRGSSQQLISFAFKEECLEDLDFRADPQDKKNLDKAILSVIGEKLAREIDLLRSAPAMDVALEAITGKLNFHKVAAKQAIIDEARRRKRYRGDEGLEDLESHEIRKSPLEDPSVPDPFKETAAKIARLIRELSLTSKQGQVVRYIVLSGEEHLNRSKIAKEVQVDRGTVDATVEKLQANLSIVSQIFLP